MSTPNASLESARRALAGIRTLYPVGNRPLSSRAVVSAGLLSLASMMLLGPSQEVSPAPLAEMSASVSAESMVSPASAAAPLVAPAPPSKPKSAYSAVLDAFSASSSFVELGALDSENGEAFNPFLVRVSQAMDSFTHTTGHEVCGVIMASEDESAWRVRLTTNRSHISCVMISFDEPGYHRLGVDIHSHPRIPGGVSVNAQDANNRKDFKCGTTMFVFDENFSGVDLRRGPGYLVSRNRLLFQRGSDYPYQQLAVFPSLETPPVLSIGTASRNHRSLEPEEAVTSAAAAWANEDAEGIPQTQCETVSPPIDPASIPRSPSSNRH